MPQIGHLKRPCGYGSDKGPWSYRMANPNEGQGGPVLPWLCELLSEVIHNFSDIACPLYALTCKTQWWVWGSPKQEVFDSLKKAITLSGRIQDWECMRCPGTCGAPTYLQGVTQGEQVPAECLSRSVIIMYKSKYIHGGLYLSRSEEKAAFSSYSSPALYNRWVTWRKELNKKAVTHY